MLEGWSGHGFWLTFTALFIVGLARGQLTYWIARVVLQGTLSRTHPTRGWRGHLHEWLQGEGLARGRRSIQRWGLIVVPLSYLTVGFQTLALAAAGAMQLRWSWFTAAQLPGAAAWALIYSTIGFAVWQAAVAAAAGSPLALAGLIAIAVVYAATVISRRIRASRASRAPPVVGALHRRSGARLPIEQTPIRADHPSPVLWLDNFHQSQTWHPQLMSHVTRSI